MSALVAITLIRPMSAAIVWGSKRIENRPRDLPNKMKGIPTIIAVHAGKKWSGDYVHTVRAIDGGIGKDQRDGVRILDGTPYEGRMDDEGIVGLMLLSGRVFRGDDTLGYDTGNPWYSGPFGYEIAAALAFPGAIPCRGMQGWWPVPDAVEAPISDAGLYDEILELAPTNVRDAYLTYHGIAA